MGLFDFLKKKKHTTEENVINEVKKEVEEVVISNEEISNNETVKDIVKDTVVEEYTEIVEESTETKVEEAEESVEKELESDVTEESLAEELESDVTEESLEEESEVDVTQVSLEQEPEIEEAKEPIEVEIDAKEESTEVKQIEEETIEEPVNEKKLGFFAKIKSGLSKTRNNILSSVDNVLKSFVKIDEDLFEELEEALIMADIGVETSLYIIEKLREKVKDERVTDASEIKRLLINVISEILEKDDEPLNLQSPTVILVIGVNGVGKTTTIGKLAHNYLSEGKSVLLAAADTFRAAAIDQLQIWGDRNNCEVIKHQENSDPAAVVFDAVNAAKARKTDILICDTAGRLHNKKNLMEELRKIAKVIDREYPEAHTEVFLVLDATTGQNAIQQAKLFSEVANITGLVLTKLDGTAKGGIVLAIKHDMNIPVRYIGVGEQINDLQPFNSKEFSNALFDEE